MDNETFLQRAKGIFDRHGTPSSSVSVMPWIQDGGTLYVSSIMNRQELTELSEEILELAGYTLEKRFRRPNRNVK